MSESRFNSPNGLPKKDNIIHIAVLRSIADGDDPPMTQRQVECQDAIADFKRRHKRAMDERDAKIRAGRRIPAND